jgi:hypothetical protein
MEPEGSLPRSQEPSTGPYPEPDQSNPYHICLGTEFGSSLQSPTRSIVPEFVWRDLEKRPKISYSIKGIGPRFESSTPRPSKSRAFILVNLLNISTQVSPIHCERTLVHKQQQDP